MLLLARTLVVSSTLLATLVLTGCGAAFHAAAPTTGAAVTGRVYGGQQPITAASISLYAAGLTASGNGTGAQSLLRVPVLTDASGSFTITADYTCPTAATQIYLVSRGGNPGLPPAGNSTASNPAEVMMTALGDCGNLTPSTFITVNETTTAAAAWALAPFAAPGAIVGASTSNATGLRNAFLVANAIVNQATGTARGATLPATAKLESAKLYTLADVLAVCVNSNGSACAPLFTAATHNGIVPANTFDAALSIVRNPAANVTAVFNAANAQGPFQPTLAHVPNDWTLSVTYTGGGLNGPTGLGVDSTGSVWSANYFGGVVSKFSVNGIPASANGFPDSHLNENYGLAIDAQENIWITNQESPGVNHAHGSLSKFDINGNLLSGAGIFAGGVYFPYSVAADTNSTIWVGDYGRSGVTYLANDGTSLSGPLGYSPANLPFPLAVTLDAQHNAWLAVTGAAVKVTPAGVATSYSCCQTTTGIGLDPAGNVWVVDYTTSSLVLLDPGGNIQQRLSTGGIQGPQSINLDGAGQAWVTNYRGNTISGYSAVAGTNTPSVALSPTTGFGVDAGLNEPFGIASDASGNLWVSNLAANSLTQFVGLTAPVRTPHIALPAAP